MAADKTPAATKVGRPTAYTPEVAAAICARLMEGESLRKICLSEDMPTKGTVCNWLAANHPEFLDQYARAREIQAEMYADDIIDIADEKTNDTLVTDFGEMPNKEWIMRSQLRVDARKWVASKLIPKKYGNHKAIELTHEAGKSIEGFSINVKRNRDDS